MVTKTPTKKTETKATNGRPKTDGLRKPQIRVLLCLSKAREPLSRKQIAEKSPCDLAFLSTYLGAHDPDTRQANEAKRGVKGLLTLGLARAERHDVEGKDVILYSATAKGKLVASSLSKK